MPSERVQRQIDRLLDEAEAALTARDWDQVRVFAADALRLDPENADARSFLEAASRDSAAAEPPAAMERAPGPQNSSAAAQPTSFANGRYTVTKFLGEGGKKKVYLARDSRLDRDVAFALIKTEGLDEASRVRVQREAEAMGRLGAHPHIVTVFDIGEENGQPYLVLPVLAGGDVEGIIEKAPENKLTIERAVKIGIDTCLGLEFAHSKGIVHRDLKPGNVWLTEDGRAMIGDFGLAVAVDKSRLTQAGMMVGTVNYMPPEQAMGVEVGPRSDLYSLGAMLYEMVCGRPPFVGDESVAIIGQHLNTPPVAPTWHRPDCPLALEALILRLLEKDSSKRPASATEVLHALESVSPTLARTLASAAADNDAPTPSENPLYRRTFVGRENEVKQLQRAFDAGLSGQGGLVMVVGEPGIGKTALCEQLATYVALRGGKALVGHCYEEGSLSLPYLAFVEAMRSYVLARDPDGLRTDLGTGAADVARIVSEVRDRVQGVELRPAGDPEDDRWRLLQAITSFLRNASTVQPLCIVLEDLHWADRGTLDLLLHVSRNLEGARLLIVGTYRDVEVDRSHPLSGTLADLRRIANFERVPLRGLTVDEVHRMYEAIRGNVVPWEQAEQVYRQTEGNPLFVQEVLRYLVEEGFVVREDGRWVPTQGVGAGIPEGLRDVVGKRLSRLSPECNRLLSVAAVIGRDFDLATLRAVAGLGEDELLLAIEEAVRVGVLEERSLPGAVRYRFAHAFFRQSLYEEMIAPRRLRLHQEVARALEAQYASRREEHASELAEHYGQSTDRADLAKAVEYSEMASKRAMTVFAYAEAEAHLRRCLEVQEVLDPEDKARKCDLLLALGRAMLPQKNPTSVLDSVASEVWTVADSRRNSELALSAALLACEAILRSDAPQFAYKLPDWAPRVSVHAREGTTESVYADIYSALATIPVSRERAHALLRRAIEKAFSVGDNRAFFAAAGWVLGYLQALRDRPLLENLAEQVLVHDREGVPSRDLSVCLRNAARILFERGDVETAKPVWEELAGFMERTRDSALVMDVLFQQVLQQAVEGHLTEARALIESFLERGDELGIGTGFGAYSLALAVRIRLLLGEPFEDLLPPANSPRPGLAVRALTLAHLGRYAESKNIIDSFGDIGSVHDETSSYMLAALLDAGLAGGDKTVIAALLPRLASLEHHVLINYSVSVGRLLGEAAHVLAQHSESRDFYGKGLAVSERLHFRPEIALIRLDLAELLLEYYPDEHDVAIEHLDFAIAELRDMKMQPALERALRHRGLLKA